LRVPVLLLIGLLSVQTAPAAEDGESLYFSCKSCHGETGQGNEAKNAPKIAGQDVAYLQRQMVLFATGGRGANSGDAYGQQMGLIAPVYAAPERLQALLDYVESLPDLPARPTVSGDKGRGEKLFEGCAACHGVRGEGKAELNSPRLAGMSDWYMLRQVRHFRDLIRTGDQNASVMAAAVTSISDQDIRDVLAFANSLTGLPAE
jgi:cytochrome c oxidase subunit 2